MFLFQGEESSNFYLIICLTMLTSILVFNFFLKKSWWVLWFYCWGTVKKNFGCCFIHFIFVQELNFELLFTRWQVMNHMCFVDISIWVHIHLCSYELLHFGIFSIWGSLLIALQQKTGKVCVFTLLAEQNLSVEEVKMCSFIKMEMETGIWDVVVIFLVSFWFSSREVPRKGKILGSSADSV